MIAVFLHVLHLVAGVYAFLLRRTVIGLAVLSGVSVLCMMLVTVSDVLLRSVPVPVKLVGAYDLVRLFGAAAVACALPYTTAVKGHVAVEFFFHKLPRRGRIAVDTANRLLGIALFSTLAWQSAGYAHSLRISGEVSPTLQLPMHPPIYLVAFACVVVVLVIVHNLVHPGREMIKP